MCRQNPTALAKTFRITAEGFLGSFVVASQTKNMRDLSAFCTDDCIRTMGPPSFLQHVGAPPDLRMNNCEWEAQFGTMEFYRFDDCIVSHVVVDTENLKVAVKGEIVGQFLDGKRISRTSVWFMDLTPDGKRVTSVYQHIDSREAQDFRITLAAHKQAKLEGVKIKEEADGDMKST
ncbi:hypothetical protein LIA77_02176 [Sarocladium implicatum]|jgi:hypothetical protein|nr:hypothetical protein LIA77_02176 [Sarocladium implicatum]